MSPIEHNFLYSAAPYLNVANHFIAGYFLFVNTAYISMLLLAFSAIKRHSHHTQSMEKGNTFRSPFTKPVSLLVPIYNEELSIIGSVKSLLQLQYPQYEVILINDGSTDNTLAQVLKSFDLKKTKNVFRKQLPCQDIRGIYESST